MDLNSIEKLNTINPVTAKVDRKDGKSASIFIFPRKWNAHRIVLHLSVGSLALFNVTCCVAAAELEENDLLTVQPVFKHICID